MKRKNISLLIALAIFVITSMLFVSPKSEMDYYRYANNLDLIEVINTNDLTIKELENRNGKLIVECLVGEVLDAEIGAGQVLYTDTFRDINYKSVKGIQNGDIICTYIIHNPDTNYIDDVIMRFDYIIDSNK